MKAKCSLFIKKHLAISISGLVGPCKLEWLLSPAIFLGVQFLLAKVATVYFQRIDLARAKHFHWLAESNMVPSQFLFQLRVCFSFKCAFHSTPQDQDEQTHDQDKQ